MTTISPAIPVLAREGTLSDTTSGLLVTELVTSSAISGLWETRLSDSSEVFGSSPTPTDVMAGLVTMMVSPDEVSRYTDYPLSNGASIESTSGGMLVHGLGEVAELEYLYVSTVTDKDGGTDTDDAQAIVVGSGDPLPPPPQIPEPPPLVTCNPAVTLDSQETLFLDLLNAYRVQAGVAPLEASPALTKAALRHALDMAANSFTEHIGSDGSDPIQRALEEGYPIDNVGENLASGLDSAANVLAGWKSSPAHNQNMLDPLWVAIGISRELDTTSYWATSFGEVLDCPTALLISEEEPAIILASASFTVNEPGSTSNLSDNAIVLSSRDAIGAAKIVDTRPTMIPIPSAKTLVQLPQIAPLLPFLPTTALVISNLNLEIGDIVTFTNVSRDATGQPVSASLRTGDGGGPFNLGPGESRQHTYTIDGTFTVSLLSSDADGQFLSVERDISCQRATTVATARPGL